MSQSRTNPSGPATLSRENLWGAIPAVLLALAWAAFGLMLLTAHPVETRDYYTALAAKALAAKDFKTARVASQRLLLSWPDTDREKNEYNLALALFGLGQSQAGGALLNLAAPVDQPGYAPAQLLLAHFLLIQPQATETLRRQAELHLDQVQDTGTNLDEARAMLGQIEFQRGDWAAAKTNLLAAVTTRPDAGLMLAVIARKAGDTNSVWQWSGVALDYYYNRVTKATVDDPPDRLGWAQALSLRENYAEAIQLLREGIRQSGETVYAAALAELYAYSAAKLARDEPGNLAARLKQFQLGLAFHPQDFRLLEPLLALTSVSAPDSAATRQTLATLIANDEAAPLAHLLLGNLAAENGDAITARQEITQAFQLSPKLKVVANNLVLLLVLTKDPDLPRALALVQPLVATMPNQPDFRNTRGQIYVQQGRWAAAVDDLEFALPQVLDKSATHAALAQAYAHLGMSELAAEHARLAREPASPAPREP